MKISFLHISHISHHSCKIHALLYIFFEHFHDFKTHTYVQIKIKFLKIAFLSKYCKFDTWSYSFLKLNYMTFIFFSLWTWFAFFLVFKLDHIISHFYKEKRFHMKRKGFTWKRKGFYLVILLLDIDSNSLNIAIWSMKLISSWISLIIASYLNIVKHSISFEFSWTCRMNLTEHIV